MQVNRNQLKGTKKKNYDSNTNQHQYQHKNKKNYKIKQTKHVIKHERDNFSNRNYDYIVQYIFTRYEMKT